MPVPRLGQRSSRAAADLSPVVARAVNLAICLALGPSAVCPRGIVTKWCQIQTNCQPFVSLSADELLSGSRGVSFVVSHNSSHTISMDLSIYHIYLILLFYTARKIEAHFLCATDFPLSNCPSCLQWMFVSVSVFSFVFVSVAAFVSVSLNEYAFVSINVCLCICICI